MGIVGAGRLLRGASDHRDRLTRPADLRRPDRTRPASSRSTCHVRRCSQSTTPVPPRRSAGLACLFPEDYATLGGRMTPGSSWRLLGGGWVRCRAGLERGWRSSVGDSLRGKPLQCGDHVCDGLLAGFPSAAARAVSWASTSVTTMRASGRIGGRASQNRARVTRRLVAGRSKLAGSNFSPTWESAHICISWCALWAGLARIAFSS